MKHVNQTAITEVLKCLIVNKSSALLKTNPILLICVGPGKYLIKDDFLKSHYAITWGHSERSPYFPGADPSISERPLTGFSEFTTNFTWTIQVLYCKCNTHVSSEKLQH